MPNKKHAKEWLEKAQHNLQAAKILFDADHFTDVIGIELHQAIEKILKAIPAYYNNKINRIHDLALLLKESEKFVDIKPSYFNLCEIATDYYSTERYPLFQHNLPPKEEIKKVMNMANDLYIAVVNLIER